MQRDHLLVAEMNGAAERIVDLVGDRTPSEISTDDLRRDAMLWNFTVLGEAAAQVSEELKADHADVSWSDPIRLRNRIVHGYWSIDMDVLVATATEDLPGFAERLRAIETGFDEV